MDISIQLPEYELFWYLVSLSLGIVLVLLWKYNTERVYNHYSQDPNSRSYIESKLSLQPAYLGLGTNYYTHLMILPIASILISMHILSIVRIDGETISSSSNTIFISAVAVVILITIISFIPGRAHIIRTRNKAAKKWNKLNKDKPPIKPWKE